jgi:predicted transcriptional regulator of viral defense system
MRDITEVTTISKTKQTPDRSRLFEIASEQGGYFTAEQATTCGYSRALLSHHVKSGTFIRIRRGLYRFREYPSSSREDVLAAWMAVGKDSSMVSHESALDILGLSDIIPDVVHLTVPRSRRNFPSFPGVKIHTTTKPIRKEDTVNRDGMIITSAKRSILDAAEAGAAPEQIKMAVIQAIDRGLVTPQSLRDEADKRGRRVSKLIADSLHRTKQ